MKEHYQENKRQPTEREITFANHVFDKCRVSRIYKELLKLKKRTNNST